MFIVIQSKLNHVLNLSHRASHSEVLSIKSNDLIYWGCLKQFYFPGSIQMGYWYVLHDLLWWSQCPGKESLSIKMMQLTKSQRFAIMTLQHNDQSLLLFDQYRQPQNMKQQLLYLDSIIVLILTTNMVKVVNLWSEAEELISRTSLWLTE